MEGSNDREDDRGMLLAEPVNRLSATYGKTRMRRKG